MAERRAIAAMRLAFWGSDEDVRAHARAHAANLTPNEGRARGVADVETALAAFGLREE